MTVKNLCLRKLSRSAFDLCVAVGTDLEHVRIMMQMTFAKRGVLPPADFLAYATDGAYSDKRVLDWSLPIEMQPGITRTANSVVFERVASAT